MSRPPPTLLVTWENGQRLLDASTEKAQDAIARDIRKQAHEILRWYH